MLKRSNLLVIIVLLGSCSIFKKEVNLISLEPFVKQYLEVFISDNTFLDTENDFITISTKNINENEFILVISSDMQENVYLTLTDYSDTVYFTNFNKFRIVIYGNNPHLFKTTGEKYVFRINNPHEIIPISYNGAIWFLTIKDQKLNDFYYQCSEPDIDVIEQLKSIPINPIGMDNED